MPLESEILTTPVYCNVLRTKRVDICKLLKIMFGTKEGLSKFYLLLGIIFNTSEFLRILSQ